MKEAWNSACNDEQVIYYVTAVPGAPDSVALDARKVVDGKPEPMGTLALGYDAGDEGMGRRLEQCALPPPLVVRGWTGRR